jgi:hypothetical protein
MKTFVKILLIQAVVLVCACKKDNHSGSSSVNTSLTGKWKLSGYYSSNGGPQVFTPATAKNNYDYIQFDANGNLAGTLYPGYSKYTIKDSTTITLLLPTIHCKIKITGMPSKQ